MAREPNNYWIYGPLRLILAVPALVIVCLVGRLTDAAIRVAHPYVADLGTEAVVAVAVFVIALLVMVAGQAIARRIALLFQL